MYKYAVAHVNFFDNVLEMTVVEAENPIVGLIEGARQLMGAKEDDPWLNEFLDADYTSDKYAPVLEEIRNRFFDADTLVEVMPI